MKQLREALRSKKGQLNYDLSKTPTDKGENDNAGHVCRILLLEITVRFNPYL